MNAFVVTLDDNIERKALRESRLTVEELIASR